MQVKEIEIGSFIKYAENGEINKLRSQSDVNVIIVSGKTIDISGIHILMPYGLADTLFPPSGYISLGPTYDLWLDAHLNSKEEASKTEIQLRKFGSSLKHWGGYALSVSYLYGPSEKKLRSKNPLFASFVVPNTVLEQALKFVNSTKAAILEWALFEVELIGYNREKDKSFSDLFHAPLMNSAFGLDEKNLEEKWRTRVTYEGNSLRTFAVWRDATRIELKQIRTDLASIMGHMSDTRKIEVLKRVAACRDGIFLQWPACYPCFDSHDVVGLIEDRIAFICELAMPHFHANIFRRPVGRDGEYAGMIDHLAWVLRDHPGSLGKVLVQLERYGIMMAKKYPWLITDYLAGKVEIPPVVAFAQTDYFNSVKRKHFTDDHWIPSDMGFFSWHKEKPVKTVTSQPLS